jgi:hypothetical protein
MTLSTLTVTIFANVLLLRFLDVGTGTAPFMKPSVIVKVPGLLAAPVGPNSINASAVVGEFV